MEKLIDNYSLKNKEKDLSPRVKEVFTFNDKSIYVLPQNEIIQYRLKSLAYSGAILSPQDKVYIKTNIIRLLQDTISLGEAHNNDIMKVFGNKKNILESCRGLGIDLASAKNTLVEIDKQVYKRLFSSIENKNSISIHNAGNYINILQNNSEIPEHVEDSLHTKILLSCNERITEMIKRKDMGTYDLGLILRIYKQLETDLTLDVSSINSISKQKQILVGYIEKDITQNIDIKKLDIYTINSYFKKIYEYYNIGEYLSINIIAEYKKVCEIFLKESKETIDDNIQTAMQERQVYEINYNINTSQELYTKYTSMIQQLNTAHHNELGLYEHYGVQLKNNAMYLSISIDNELIYELKCTPPFGSNLQSMILKDSITGKQKTIFMPMFNNLLQIGELGDYLNEKIHFSDEKEYLEKYDIQQGTRYIDILCESDPVGGEVYMQSLLLKQTMQEKYNMKTQETIINNDFMGVFGATIEEFYAKGEKDFFVNIMTHGMSDSLNFQNPIVAEDLFTYIHHSFPNIQISIYTVACFGGGLIRGYTSFLEKYPNTHIKINIFTESHDSTPNYLMKFNEARESKFLHSTKKDNYASYGTPIGMYLYQGLLEGKTFGKSFYDADQKAQKRNLSDGEAILQTTKKEDTSGYHYFSQIDTIKILGHTLT